MGYHDLPQGQAPFSIFLLYAGIPLSLVLVFVVFPMLWRRRRNRAMEALAAALGLNYRRYGLPEACKNKATYDRWFDSVLADKFSLPRTLAALTPPCRGGFVTYRDVFWGTYRGVEVAVFQFDPMVGAMGSAKASRYGVYAARLPVDFPMATIRHETAGELIAENFGTRDLQFESAEFNKRYQVFCHDEKFAYELLHPRMIDYMLSIPELYWQVGGNYVVILTSGCLVSSTIESYLNALANFSELVPEYMLEDRKLPKTWTNVWD